MHSRNSCKTLKCPKCNWHYKYHETLEIHMKEKHPETETSCIYCIAGQPHPRLARGETYTCGYKPYRCEVCNYSTTTKGNLSIHMQSDKHLNNMQELQNGTVTNSELTTHQQSAPPVSQQHSKPTGMSSPGAGGSGLVPYHSTIASNQTQKPKPTFRCDVCNYETNVARNLRIHMTSEKHTHNILVLQQNMKQIQAISAIQQSQHQPQLNFEQSMHYHPALTLPGEKPPPHSEAALADMAYNHALIIQLMTGGQLPPHVAPELSPNLDMGLNPETMEPPPEPADPNPDHLFQCCVCNIFTTDSLEALSHHLAADRTKIREQEILAIVAGHYVCKLCTYKTTLKANFQLHCKTDKHLQRLQHVNHVKEGGVRNEWKLKYVSSPGSVQVRCNACDYYTNSTHKLQLHSAAQRHKFSSTLFRHLRDNYDESGMGYHCVLCEFSCTDKLPLFQHVRKHLQIEQMHQLQGVTPEKHMQNNSVNSEGLLRLLMLVDQSHWLNNAKPNTCNLQTTPPSQHFSPSSTISPGDKDAGARSAVSPGDKDAGARCTLSPADKDPDARCAPSPGDKDADARYGQSGQSDSSRADTEEVDETGDQFDSDGGLRCPSCGKTFRNGDELCLHQNENGHFDIKQMEGVPAFLCPKKDCSAYFTTVLNVQRHYLEAHIQRTRVNTVAVSEKHVYKYRCSQCSLAFKTMEKLQLHSQYHFIRDATKCVLCGRSFRSIIALQKHVESSHADLSEEEMLIFKQSLLSNPLLLAGLSGQVLDPSITELLKKESLRMDADESMDEDNVNKEGEDGSMTVGGTENSDEEDETYKEQFIEDYLNSQAIAEENYNDPNRKYKCHKCKMAFTRQSYLTLHNKKVPHRKGEKVIYPMEKYLDPNRPYKCEVCKESFTQKNILLVHYNSVSHLHKLKRASQDSQNNSLQSTPGSELMISPPSSQMLTPKSNQDPNRPHKCEVCKESFMQKNSLLLHYNSVGHLHKLKRASQESQNNSLLSTPGSNLMISPPCNQLLTPKSNPNSSMSMLTSSSPINDCAQNSHGSLMSSPTSGTATTDLMKTPPPAPSLLLGVSDESFMKLPSQAKKPSHMYKHLLESFGFDLVMQFNENHQRRQRKEREESERLLMAELQSAQFMSEETPTIEARKESSIADPVREEKDETPSADELPEVSKSTCAHCDKEFSSVWVLKAHCEEVHKDLVPLDFLEKYAQQIKCKIDKKAPGTISSAVSNDSEGNANADLATGKVEDALAVLASPAASISTLTTADVGTDVYASHRDDQENGDEHGGALNMSTVANVTDNSHATDTSLYDDSEKDSEDHKDVPSRMTFQNTHDTSVTPNPPTACSTPASSTDSIPPTVGGVASNNPSPNIQMSLAQMTEMHAAAMNALAAGQLQQQLQQFNPMMMGMAGLGMGGMSLSLGMNLPALAAMTLQPPLVPLGMMPPPTFDPMGGLGAVQNALFSQQASNMDLAKQQQHLIQQQQQVVSNFRVVVTGEHA